jgi:hypothetical protein
VRERNRFFPWHSKKDIGGYHIRVLDFYPPMVDSQEGQILAGDPGVGRRGTNQLHLMERYLDVLVKHTTDIPPPTALVEVCPQLP